MIYGKSSGTITFDRDDLERSKSRSFRFRMLITYKGAKLGHTLLLNSNKKSYMGSPWHHYIRCWVILKSQNQGHSDFEAIYLIMEPC